MDAVSIRAGSESNFGDMEEIFTPGAAAASRKRNDQDDSAMEYRGKIRVCKYCKHTPDTVSVLYQSEYLRLNVQQLKVLFHMKKFWPWKQDADNNAVGKQCQV